MSIPWGRPGPSLPIVASAGGDCGWLNPRAVDSTQLIQELWGSHGGACGGVKGSAMSRHGFPVMGHDQSQVLESGGGCDVMGTTW